MGMYTMLTPGDMPADCENCGTTHTAEDLDMRSCDHQCCQSCIDSIDEDCPACEAEAEAEDDGEEFHGEVMERLDVLCALADAVAVEMARPEELIGADTIEALTRAKAALDAATDAAFAHAREATQ